MRCAALGGLAGGKGGNANSRALSQNYITGLRLRGRNALDPPRLGERQECGSHPIEEAGWEDTVLDTGRLRPWDRSEIVARPPEIVDLFENDPRRLPVES